MYFHRETCPFMHWSVDTTQNIRVQRTQAKKEKDSRSTAYVARTPSAWELADTPVPSQRQKGRKEPPRSVLRLLSCLKFWELLAERTGNLVYSLKPPSLSCYLSCMLIPSSALPLFYLDPFPFVLSWFFPVNRLPSPFYLACLWLWKNDAGSNDEESTAYTYLSFYLSLYLSI